MSVETAAPRVFDLLTDSHYAVWSPYLLLKKSKVSLTFIINEQNLCGHFLHGKEKKSIVFLGDISSINKGDKKLGKIDLGTHSKLWFLFK